MREETIGRILAGRLIAILRGIPPEQVLPVAEAIQAGGIDLIEVTFDQRSPDSFFQTARAIEAVAAHFGGRVLAGAGTVLTAAQCRMAAQAGARYLVSPHADPAVIAETRKLGLVSIPGVLTPSEMVAAHAAGADFCKLFPAGSLGPGYIKAVRGPLPHLRLLAVGGVDAGSIPAYLEAGCVGFGIGGNLADPGLAARGEYDTITGTARALVRAARPDAG